MIVLLAALMLFAAFWLPFTIGRCVLSALAGLQLDHASLVLKAMAHNPAQLRSGALVHAPPPGSAASSQEDATGLAAAVMVLERVLLVQLAPRCSIECASLLCTVEALLAMQTLSCHI